MVARSTPRGALLRPGEVVADALRRQHTLPRFLRDQIVGAGQSHALAPHFIAELITVDCREARCCSKSFRTTCRARFRSSALSGSVSPARRCAGFIAANGGYRSPAHAFCQPPDPHAWATAANIYRVGDHWLDDREAIEKYARLAEAVAPEFFAKPFGFGPDETDDHLHLDLGYVTFVPRDCDEAP